MNRLSIVVPVVITAVIIATLLGIVFSRVPNANGHVQCSETLKIWSAIASISKELEQIKTEILELRCAILKLAWYVESQLTEVKHQLYVLASSVGMLHVLFIFSIVLTVVLVGGVGFLVLKLSHDYAEDVALLTRGGSETLRTVLSQVKPSKARIVTLIMLLVALVVCLVLLV